MKQRMMWSLGVLVLLLAGNDGDVAQAQPQSRGDGPPAEPVALGPAARQAMFAKAIKAAGGTPSNAPPPPAQFKLKPTQLSQNGAIITKLGSGTILSNTLGDNTAFVLEPVKALTGEEYYPSMVVFQFPTEPYKLYAIDCSVIASQPMEFSRAGAPPQSVTMETGHAIYAFRATTNLQQVTLRTTTKHYATFRGCEIVKTD